MGNEGLDWCSTGQRRRKLWKRQLRRNGMVDWWAISSELIVDGLYAVSYYHTLHYTGQLRPGIGWGQWKCPTIETRSACEGYCYTVEPPIKGQPLIKDTSQCPKNSYPHCNNTFRNLWEEDNLSTMDTTVDPKVSFARRFHCNSRYKQWTWHIPMSLIASTPTILWIVTIINSSLVEVGLIGAVAILYICMLCAGGRDQSSDSVTSNFHRCCAAQVPPPTSCAAGKETRFPCQTWGKYSIHILLMH